MRRLRAVDPSSLASWLAAIPLSDWPQQTPLGDGQLRPAMVSDPAWHGFGAVAGPIVRQIESSRTQQWMLSVVMPGHEIEAHRDEQPPHWRHRVHVPIASNEQAWFLIEGVGHHMEVGFAYAIDTRRLHRIVNQGRSPRIHLMFDVMA